METSRPERATLVTDIASVIVQAVNLRPASPLTEDTPLRGSGLELDSIDILEIVVTIEQRFGVKIKETDDGPAIFRTVGTIADFVQARQS